MKPCLRDPAEQHGAKLVRFPSSGSLEDVNFIEKFDEELGASPLRKPIQRPRKYSPVQFTADGLRAIRPPYPELHLIPTNGSFVPRKISLARGRVCNLGRPSPELLSSVAAHTGLFDSRVVSSRHAQVWSKDGKMFIKDLNSSNGTYVNGAPLRPFSQLELKSGDRLELGVDVDEEDNTTVHRIAATVYCIFHPDDLSVLPNGPVPEATSTHQPVTSDAFFKNEDDAYLVAGDDLVLSPEHVGNAASLSASATQPFSTSPTSSPAGLEPDAPVTPTASPASSPDSSPQTPDDRELPPSASPTPGKRRPVLRRLPTSMQFPGFSEEPLARQPTVHPSRRPRPATASALALLSIMETSATGTDALMGYGTEGVQDEQAQTKVDTPAPVAGLKRKHKPEGVDGGVEADGMSMEGGPSKRSKTNRVYDESTMPHFVEKMSGESEEAEVEALLGSMDIE